MNIVINLVLALQILTALVMIGLVLIQHGKGADMGASFGSGASGSLFGATGSANFLSRSTAVLRRGLLRLHAVPRLQRQRSAEGRIGQHPRPSGRERVGVLGRRLRCGGDSRRSERRDRVAGTRADGRAERAAEHSDERVRSGRDSSEVEVSA